MSWAEESSKVFVSLANFNFHKKMNNNSKI